MVSHNLEQIQQWAKTAALLAKGKVVFLGNPVEAVAHYRDPKYQEYR